MRSQSRYISQPRPQRYNNHRLQVTCKSFLGLDLFVMYTQDLRLKPNKAFNWLKMNEAKINSVKFLRFYPCGCHNTPLKFARKISRRIFRLMLYITTSRRGVSSDSCLLLDATPNFDVKNFHLDDGRRLPSERGLHLPKQTAAVVAQRILAHV